MGTRRHRPCDATRWWDMRTEARTRKVETTIDYSTVPLNFGKHEGQPITSVPRQYLRWVIRNLPQARLVPTIRRYLRETKQAA